MNRKFIIYLSLIAAAFPFHCITSPAQNAWVKNDNAVHNLVWEDKLYRQAEFLSSPLCEGRATGSAGNNEAAFWLVRNFRKYGLARIGDSYARHIYAGLGLVGHNIIGMIPGSVKDPCDSYIIVGTHFDGLGRIGDNLYPGADSDVSGMVAMTSLAEMFSSMKTIGKVYGKSIIFAAFDGNEMNLAGSSALWRSISEGDLTDPFSGKAITKEKISLMVNIDQIGSSLSPLKSGKKNYLIMLGNESLAQDREGLISMCNRFYGTDLEISHTYYGSKDFTKIFYTLSDQKVFVENRVPSVLFTSGITMNNNKTSDTVDTLDMEALRKRIILIFHWLEKML